MAKNNMLLGYARGKVGDLVFQRRKGEQIVKARNRNPNNPRTWSQQMQRVRMYAPVAFYKMAVENFFRFAFEDKKYNETDYNAFIRENLDAFQGPYFTREQAAQKFPVIAPYVISSGKLGNIEATLAISTTKRPLVEATLHNVTFIETENTVGNISRALINEYNLKEGDMLTFVEIIIKGIEVRNEGNVKYNGSTGFYYNNFVVDTTSTQTIPTAIPEGSTRGFMKVSGEKDTTLISYFPGTTTDSDIIGYAIITTRRENGKIIASNTSLNMNEQAQAYFEAMSTAQQLIRAAASYDATMSALDPNSAKVMNEASSQTNSKEERSTKQTAMNCLQNNGSKRTSGVQSFTLDNECPSCECNIHETEPYGCNEEVQATSKSRRRNSANIEN